jgi:bacteriocin-like protein
MDPKAMTVETPETVAVAIETKALELSDAELENVSGGFLDNLAAKCEISGGLNLLSSNVAIELG